MALYGARSVIFFCEGGRAARGPEGALYCFGQQIALALLLPLLLSQLYSRRSAHKRFAEPLEDLRQFPGALPLSWERFLRPAAQGPGLVWAARNPGGRYQSPSCLHGGGSIYRSPGVPEIQAALAPERRAPTLRDAQGLSQIRRQLPQQSVFAAVAVLLSSIYT